MYAVGKKYAKVKGTIDDYLDESVEVGLVYYHHNNLGSTRVMTNQDGEKVFDQDYLPFGGDLPKAGQLEVQNETNESYKFTGQKQVASIGLYYYKARYYDPSIGRFNRHDIHRGKTKEPQSQHCYIYVTNNPLKYTDPNGLEKIALKNGGYKFTNLNYNLTFYPAGKIDSKSTGFHLSKKRAEKGKMVYGTTVKGNKVFSMEGLERLDKKYTTKEHWKAAGSFFLSAAVDMSYLGGITTGLAANGVKGASKEAVKGLIPDDEKGLLNTSLSIRDAGDSANVDEAKLGALKSFIPLKGTIDSFNNLKAHAARYKIKRFEQLEVKSDRVVLKDAPIDLED